MIHLGQKPLQLEQVQSVARKGEKVGLSPGAIARIKRAHQYLKAEIAKGDAIYGVNTGFGILSNVRIPDSQIEQLQVNLLRSHACGVGPYLDDVESRAMLLLRAANLASGNSGVSLKTVQQILLLLNRGVCPLIPSQGSVGASGDLAPLSHLALVLIGEGRARFRGKIMSGSQALRAANIKPIRLGPKEGLALINGTQFMTALGVLNLLDAERLADLAELAGAMTLEALRGTDTAFDSAIHRVRPHAGQLEVAKRMRAILAPQGQKSAIAKSHADCGKVQDPYSLRCIPQVHGASRDALKFVRTILETEINSVTDNPLIFPAEKKILSGGNFHGQYVSMAMDFLSIAVAELASISEQRLEKLINPALSDLPAFLTSSSGVNSGFMIVQVAAASLVSENKTLCHPACVDTIPTSADKEDHVSMGAWAARKAKQVVQNTQRVLAMELFAAGQGIELLRPLKSTPKIEAVIRSMRRKVKRVEQDRFFHDDLVHLEEMITTGELSRAMEDT